MHRRPASRTKSIPRTPKEPDLRTSERQRYTVGHNIKAIPTRASYVFSDTSRRIGNGREAFSHGSIGVGGTVRSQ